MSALDWTRARELDDALTLPAALYTDAAMVRDEASRVFARSWQLVARSSQLLGVGDHVVCEIAGVPLLLVRGEDQQLRALHNVCRHRAGPLAVCGGRGARQLRCRYHGWTYALDGRLRNAVEMETAVAFDPGAVRLPQVHVASWRGLVFAALNPVGTLDQLVAEIDARSAHPVLHQHTFARRDSYELACNWKTYVDNFLEGYHLPHVHPELNRLLDYRSYRTELFTGTSLQWSPLESVDSPYGNGEAHYWWIWPNTMLNVLPGRVQTNRVVALDSQRCRVDFDYWYADPNDAARVAADASFSDRVQHEDVAICEQVQANLASGSYTCGRINPLREQGVFHFHQLLRAAFREPAADQL